MVPCAEVALVEVAEANFTGASLKRRSGRPEEIGARPTVTPECGKRANCVPGLAMRRRIGALPLTADIPIVQRYRLRVSLRERCRLFLVSPPASCWLCQAQTGGKLHAVQGTE